MLRHRAETDTQKAAGTKEGRKPGERDIFSRLNEAEERRPGHEGSQVDLGPRDSADGMKAPHADASASPGVE